MFAFTQLQSLYSQDVSDTRLMDWPGIVTHLTHVPLANKHAGQMFTACTFKEPQGRNERNVRQASLLIYDVDTFTPGGAEAELRTTLERLQAKNVAFFLYSSYSHNPPEKHAYRLVIPLDRPLEPGYWRRVHEVVLQEFKISARADKCKGPSHPYYLPAHPPGIVPFRYRFEGAPLDTSSRLLNYIPPVQAESLDVEIPESPSAGVNLSEILENLRKGSPLGEPGSQKRKAWMAFLKGEALAPAGERNAALLAVTGSLVFRLPNDTAMETYFALMHPCLQATYGEVPDAVVKKIRSQLVGALKRKVAQHMQEDELQERLWRNIENWKKNLPTIKGK